VNGEVTKKFRLWNFKIYIGLTLEICFSQIGPKSTEYRV